jgi:hypothetical protein
MWTRSLPSTWKQSICWMKHLKSNFVVNTGDSDHEFTDLSDDENDGNISGVDTLSDVD